MLLQLKSLFLGETEHLPVDCALDFSGVEWNGLYPFQEPVRVTGQVRLSASVVIFKAAARYRYDGVCDRCMRPVSRERVLPMEHILVVSLNHEENDSFVLLDNYQLPLDALVEEDLILDQPSKVLCSEECRGLCPLCGKDLNEGLCGCRPETADPRLAALQQLLD